MLRPCYLALRRAVTLANRPNKVIVLNEPDRALTERDIEEVLGVSVAATLDVHPDIARAVDAGLLTARPPRHALRSLHAIVRADEAVES